jgi:hypothetical protein
VAGNRAENGSLEPRSSVRADYEEICRRAFLDERFSGVILDKTLLDL